MPNPAEGLLEASEDMVDVLLVPKVFLTEICRLKICPVLLLPVLKHACCSAMIFSTYGLNLFSTWVADEADCSVVLAPLQVAFLGKCDD